MSPDRKAKGPIAAQSTRLNILAGLEYTLESWECQLKRPRRNKLVSKSKAKQAKNQSFPPSSMSRRCAQTYSWSSHLRRSGFKVSLPISNNPHSGWVSSSRVIQTRQFPLTYIRLFQLIPDVVMVTTENSHRTHQADGRRGAL